MFEVNLLMLIVIDEKTSKIYLPVMLSDHAFGSRASTVLIGNNATE